MLQQAQGWPQVGQENPKGWINLERAKILLLEDQATALNIMTQIISAFGCQRFYRCGSVEEAKEVISTEELHLIFVNANLKESPAYDFINWLRTSNIQPNAFTPVIMVTGHTQRRNVERARDCGANIVLSKPVSPTSTLERIAIIAREKRPYVSCATYVGPDRRFHDIPPPDGVRKRYNDPVDAPEKGDSAGANEDGEAA
jgi:DNA-binding response OmpR family regulator